MKVNLNSITSFFSKVKSKESRKKFWDLIHNGIIGTATFSLLLLVYLITSLFRGVGKNRFFPKAISHQSAKFLTPIYQKIVNMTGSSRGTISRIDLIELAIRNMSFKKNRSFITIGGMALGIGAIVFLVSLGYGVNKLVVDKVARLEELEQADITPQTGSNVKINASILKDFKKIENVDKVLPQIAVVAKVNFQNSISDMAVYGVTTEYLEQSAIKPVAGNLFDSNQINLEVDKKIIQIEEAIEASSSVDIQSEGRYLADISYNIPDHQWVAVYSQPNSQAEVLGYTQAFVDGWQTSAEYLGESYYSEDETGKIAQDVDGSWLGKWVKDDFLLWQQDTCLADDDSCSAGVYNKITNDDDQQVSQVGFIRSDRVVFQDDESEVLGAVSEIELIDAEYGDKNADVEFVIYPDQWLKVREEANTDSKIVGYTKRFEGVGSGEEVWGEEYEDQSVTKQYYNPKTEEYFGKWIQAPVKLWEKTDCDESLPECVDGEYLAISDDKGSQAQIDAYMAEINMKVVDVSIKYPSVLGVSIDTEDYVLGDSDDLLADSEAGEDFIEAEDWVEIASEAGIVAPTEKVTVKFDENSVKEAVVNVSMLRILGLSNEEAIGKTFESSFVVVGDLLDTEYQVESESVEYKIVGVIPEDKAPFFYVPFYDLQQMGIRNFSQAKIVVDNKDKLQNVRTEIESKGFSTSSVTDTVAQIDSLFGTIRSVLALLGMVALAVASLGMFNTLTVSLLERTREVGLMKAMGMKSYEVRELFLTESMVMGFFGGFFGILFGFAAGKLLGVFLSIFSLTKGQGLIDISFIPIMFVTTVFLLSLFVGIVTGIYPARRATKISALNALRYE